MRTKKSEFKIITENNMLGQLKMSYGIAMPDNLDTRNTYRSSFPSIYL